MTTSEPPAQRAGTLTITARPVRPEPAILIREIEIGAAIEIDVLGVDGAYLDAALERIRGNLQRFATVVGHDVRLTPVGHPDAPSGYRVGGLTLDQVERAIGAWVDGMARLSRAARIDLEGRW